MVTLRARIASVILLLPVLALTGTQPGGVATEAEIKAAMVFNFTRFIEWGGTKGDARLPLIIGVAGDDSIHDAVEELLRTPSGGRAVELRSIRQPSDAETCHLVFLGGKWKKRVPELAGFVRRGLVTVGDGEGFLDSGGAIGFIVDGNKLRFAVSLAATGQAGVTVSSRLLRLAKEVRP